MEWHTSSYSSPNNDNCVEVVEGLPTLIRDSQNRKLGQLAFGSTEWRAFIQGVRSGEL
ncbi:DUF397 domain-containing protein [Nocardiopsis mangrovi]|uniref:DUF397 domain-containing protein n=1 Tax=Nocardiopsis mangrovi TaxID=1179818 RepID=A0ABV9E4B7_9ACTN